MPLHAHPDAERERILLYGAPGAGKTYAWLGIADLSQKTKSSAHFHVIDTDRAALRNLKGPLAEFGHLKNVTIYQARNVVEAEEANGKILANVTEDDWIIVDMLSNMWDGMSNWWITRVFDDVDSPADYWASVRQDIRNAKMSEDKKGDAREFGGQASPDWEYIKKAYLSWELPITIDAPCHVLCTAAEVEIQERYDPTGERRAQYVSTNFMAPRGQKLTEHRFHSVLRITALTSFKETSRELTMHKDRIPEAVWQGFEGRGLTMPLRSGPRFAMDYLRGALQWKLS